MSFERWGAFSVIDHKNARSLAVDVLLYDRLVLPFPPEWDRARWIKNDWDPDGLANRLTDLGDIAIKAAWDQDRQKAWREMFEQASVEARNDEMAYMFSALLLADPQFRPKLDGIEPLNVVAAYQSETDVEVMHPGMQGDMRRSKFDFLIAQQIEVPDDEDPEDSLKRSIEIANSEKFRQARHNLHEWQDLVTNRGASPEAAVKELGKLIAEYNAQIVKKAEKRRVEAAFLFGSLAAGALALISGMAPALFSALGVGALAGSNVVQVGSFAAGGILQISQFSLQRVNSVEGEDRTLPAAMFHQIEKDLGWRRRVKDK
jgi:hypothetical protein